MINFIKALLIIGPPPPAPGPPGPPGVPIDNGIIFLLLAGIALGIYTVIIKKKTALKAKVEKQKPYNNSA